VSSAIQALLQPIDPIHWDSPQNIQDALDHLNPAQPPLRENPPDLSCRTRFPLAADNPTTSKVKGLSKRLRDCAELGKWTGMHANATLLIQMAPSLPTENLAEHLIDRAVASTQLRESVTAIADTTHVIKMRPPPSEAAVAAAYWVRAQAHEQQNLWERAISDYTHFLERCADSDLILFARGSLYRGIAYEKTGNRKHALQDLQTWIFPLAATCLHPRFKNEVQSKIAQAHQILSREKGLRAEAFLEKGNRAFDEGLYGNASVCYTDAIDCAHATQSHLLRAYAEDADDFALFASKLDPKDRDTVQLALLNRGSAKMAQSLWPEAFDDFTLFLKIDSFLKAPDKELLKNVLLQRVRSSMHLGRWGHVVVDITQLIDLKLSTTAAELARLHIESGRAYEKLEFWPNAITEYSEALENCQENLPLSTQAYLYRGIAKSRTGNILGALEDLQQVDFLRAEEYAPPLFLEEIRLKIAEAQHTIMY